MSELLQFLGATIRNFETGSMTGTEELADPDGIGDPFTQDDIDFLKRLINEVKNRYPPPEVPVYLPEDEPTGPPAP